MSEMPARPLLAFVALLGLLAACSSPPREGTVPAKRGLYKLGAPYQIGGRWYYPRYESSYDRVGVASWYGDGFHGRPTANGERFDKNRLTAAHPTLPLPSLVEVVNLENGRSLVVRVNDRGPFVGDRLIDLSEAAARELGFREQGLAQVRVRFLRLADDADGTPPQPTVVAAAVTTPAQPVSPAALRGCKVGDAGYFVQLAALRDTDRVEREARRAASLGQVRVDRVGVGSGALARLRVGPFARSGAALAVLDRARAMGYQGAFVVADAGRADCEISTALDG